MDGTIDRRQFLAGAAAGASALAVIGQPFRATSLVASDVTAARPGQTPDSGDTGTVAGSTGSNNLGQFENVIDTALTYAQAFGGVNIAASVSGEFAKSEDPLLNDIAAYAAGLNIGYGGFTVGGSYGNWGDSSLITTYTADDATYWTAGVGYERGAWGVSLGYLESAYNDNEAKVVSLGAD